MAGRDPPASSDERPHEGRRVAWLRLAGALLFVLTATFWRLVLEVEALFLGLLLTILCIVLVGPGWSHPRASGAALVAGAGTFGLVLLHSAPHPLLGELTLMGPLVGAGLLLLADARFGPAPPRASGLRG